MATGSAAKSSIKGQVGNSQNASTGVGPGGGRIKRKPQPPQSTNGTGFYIKTWWENEKFRLLTGIIILILGTLVTLWINHSSVSVGNRTQAQAQAQASTQHIKPEDSARQAEPQKSNPEQSVSELERKLDESVKNAAVSHIFTFDSREQHNRSVSFGDCPDGHCYSVEQGGRATFGNLEGQIIHLFGSGFYATSKSSKEGDTEDIGLYTVNGGEWGFHYLYKDGSDQYRWFPRNSRTMRLKDVIKDVKAIQLAVWIPWEKEKRIDMVTPGQNVSLTIIDDAINHSKIRIDVSPGTFCSIKELYQQSLAGRVACKDRI